MHTGPATDKNCDGRNASARKCTLFGVFAAFAVAYIVVELSLVLTRMDFATPSNSISNFFDRPQSYILLQDFQDKSELLRGNFPNSAVSPGATALCDTTPGMFLNAERGVRGFQVLYEIYYLMPRRAPLPDSRLLCIFTDFPTLNFQKVAIETYGSCCEGILWVAKSAPPVFEFLPTNSTFPSPQVHWTSKSVSPMSLLQYVYHNLCEQYDWFYLARPDRYFVVEHARQRIRLGKVSSTVRAATLERYIMEDPDGKDPVTGKMYMGRKTNATLPNPGGCQDSTLWNRSALLRLLESGLKRDPEDKSTAEVILKALSKLPIECVRGFDHTSIHKYQQYTELRLLELESANAMILALRRTHALLTGDCEAQWRGRLGALDAHGQPGYVHDPTFLRKHSVAMFQYRPPGYGEAICERPFAQGPEGKAGYQGLRKIEIARTNQSIKVLCMVYTHSKKHDNLRSVVETWGSKCDGFMAASNVTDASLGAVNLLHEGPEDYGNMWLKVKAMWQYAYDHYRNDYDFFHVGGDDHYVIVENLRYTAATGNWHGPWNQSSPLYLGGPMADKFESTRYCGGGSGYTLNRVALRQLVEELLAHPDCWPHWRAPDEDRIMASCFRRTGLQCMDTNDESKESRYHPWDVNYHAQWTKRQGGNWWPSLLETRQGIPQPEGLGQISKSSVSFHLKPIKENGRNDLPPDKGMRRYHAILYGLCDNHTTGTSNTTTLRIT